MSECAGVSAHASHGCAPISHSHMLVCTAAWIYMYLFDHNTSYTLSHSHPHPRTQIIIHSYARSMYTHHAFIRSDHPFTRMHSSHTHNVRRGYGICALKKHCPSYRYTVIQKCSINLRPLFCEDPCVSTGTGDGADEGARGGADMCGGPAIGRRLHQYPRRRCAIAACFRAWRHLRGSTPPQRTRMHAAW